MTKRMEVPPLKLTSSLPVTPSLRTSFSSQGRSPETLADCLVEPGLKDAEPGFRFQFERLGDFCVDPDSSKEALVINKTIGLRDPWAKQAAKK